MRFWRSRKPLSNAQADAYSGARGLKFGLSLPLHQYFVYARIEGSGETARMLADAKSAEISRAGSFP